MIAVLASAAKLAEDLSAGSHKTIALRVLPKGIEIIGHCKGRQCIQQVDWPKVDDMLNFHIRQVDEVLTGHRREVGGRK